MSELLDLEEVAEEYRDPFARNMAIATVVATLLAGVVGFMLAVASRHADQEAAEAQRLGIQATSAQIASQQTAQADYETYTLAQEQRTHASNAEQHTLFNRAPQDLRHERLEQERWNELANKTEALTPISPTVEYGPESDPLFPAKFFTSGTKESLRLSALEDAANEISGEWGGQAGGYTAVLTIFAVALYLFGLSLTLGQESQRQFAGVGIALVVVGFLWSLFIFLRPPHAIPPEAAEEYAAGQVAYRTATSQEGFQEAVDHFSKAIELRPKFALAYARRASAEYLAGTPQKSGYVTFSAVDSLDKAAADLEHAQDLGLETFESLVSLGAYRFQQGVFHDDPDAFDESAELTEKAIDIDPTSAHTKLNLGLAQFAAGDVEEARTNLKAGAEKADTFLIASTMAVLDLLQERGPDAAAAAAPEMKAYLVGATPSPVENAPEPGDFELTDMEATLFPSQVQVKFSAEGDFDNTQDLLDVFWYHEDDNGLGWSPVPEVSAPAYAFVDSTAEGRYFIQTPYLTSTVPNRCIDAGSYKVEIYAGDKLVGTASSETEFTQMDASTFVDLNAALCRPSDWERVTDNSLSRPGLLRGYTSPDKKSGVYVFHFNVPSSYDSIKPLERSEQFLDYAVQDWDVGLPATPKVDRTEGSYFMGLDGALTKWYTYPGGYVNAGAAIDKEGSIIVGLVYGTADFLDRQPGSNGAWILNSSITYNQLVTQ
ncbi:MAG: hypothetical protein QOH90_185 [Actinomycetota bacterium]|nr:hypothetical protein [Actinomycetota bacterium]